MLRHRVIPTLLTKDHGLVKTTNFANPVYIGDPTNAIRIFNEKEVDELLLLDIGATPAGQGPNLALVADAASECFMPLGYGGGISSLRDAKSLFELGVEKVVLRTSAYSTPELISEIAQFAGSQAVAVSVDVTTDRFGRRRLIRPSGWRGKLPDWSAFIGRSVAAGAGEILLTSVDREGTMKGMDTGLIAQAANLTEVPLVAIGGVGSLADIGAGISAGADAVGAGAFFVFHGSRRAVLITYPSYGELQEMLGSTNARA